MAKMVTLQDVGLAWMLCGYLTAFGANAAPPHTRNNDGVRTESPKIQCGQDLEVIDSEKQLCCGTKENKKILTKNSNISLCCYDDQFDPRTQCCCQDSEKPRVQSNQTDCCVKQRQGVKPCQRCGEQTYDRLNQTCCNQTVVAKPAECGRGEVIDRENQLCCGTKENKKILTKNSNISLCCYDDQFDPRTQCCCQDSEKPRVQSNRTDCCVKQRQGAKAKKPVSRLNCTGPKSSICGSQCYNPTESYCCEKEPTKPIWHSPPEVIDSENQLCCGPKENKKILTKNTNNSLCCYDDQFDPRTQCCCQDSEKPRVQSNQTDCCVKQRQDPTNAVATVYNPNESICCNGRLSSLKPWMDQCCGDKPYGLAQRGVLCCNNTLLKDRENGYDSPGKHCCGSQLYDPMDEICCNGQSHPSGINIYCCGDEAYNISDPLKKCCAGALHSLQGDRDDSQCCGSFLKSSKEVCCKSEGKEVLYGAKNGFQCCGHGYYNTSLWSCCSGRLSPVNQTEKTNYSIPESRVLSLVNVNKTRLCKKFHVGVVESVSLKSTVFSSVVEIQAGNVAVKRWPSKVILETPDHCNYLKLTPGKTYFFDDVNIFTGFNPDSVLQSIHFILSECSQ